jgi:hypothetical protein
MKFAVKGLVAGALALGMLSSAPAMAGEDIVKDICKRLDADMKRIDKELAGIFKR